MTSSFQPIWSGRFDDLIPEVVPVHTLILGTHPSVKSLQEQQYYAHEQNAFWWIAGDCLGFRRGPCVSPSTGKPYVSFASHLRFDNDKILPYDEQVRMLVQHGFALWDTVGQCRRPGSLDQDIFDDRPNAIREFAQQHSETLRRIVLSNGTTGCTIFTRNFSDWLRSEELRALPDHEPSVKAFAKAIARETKKQQQPLKNNAVSSSKKPYKPIDLICAMGVSPAAAKFSYVEKRASWEKYVYEPGLKDWERLRLQQQIRQQQQE